MSDMYTDKAVNAAFFEQLMSDNSTLQKSAMSSATEYTRTSLREEGILRRVFNPEHVTTADLDPQHDTPKPCIIVERETESPGAVSLPFGALPSNRYIKGDRYRVMFDRIATPNFTIDVQELGGYNMDIRSVMADNAIKDMLAEEDGKGLRTVDSLLLGPDTVIPLTGVAQWVTFAGGITRQTYPRSLRIMNYSTGHFEPATAVLNHVTVKEFYTWGFDAVGGDLSQEIAIKGFGERTWFGMRHITTIKRDLVEDGTVYQFVEPKALGKFYILEDATMAIERKFYLLNFFAYACIGGAIGNVAGVARADFAMGSS